MTNLARGPLSKQSTSANYSEPDFPGSLAWIRQITLWQIITNPKLLTHYPRIFLEKPWLPIVLFASVGFVLGIISGAGQGKAGEIGNTMAITAACSVLGCAIAAVIMLPVSFVLWLIRLIVDRTGRQKPLDPSRKIVRIGETSIEFDHQLFPFRPNRIISAFMLFLALAGEAVLCYLARIEGNWLFFGMACLVPLGLVGLIANLFHAFFGKESVVLTDSEIILPKINRFGFYAGVICVAFRDVSEVRIGPVGLTVHHRQGKFHLQTFMFSGRRVFDTVVALLTDSVNKNRQS